MIKVSECQLCGNYFRTGKIRQILEKVLVFDADGKKAKFFESKMLVCKDCYKRILEGKGVAKVSDGMFQGNSLDDLFREKEAPVASEGKAPEVEGQPKERKKRGRKPKSELISKPAVEPTVEEQAPADPLRMALKEKIRERYNAEGSVMYEDLAREFDADVALVTEICDELDKEKATK